MSRLRSTPEGNLRVLPDGGRAGRAIPFKGPDRQRSRKGQGGHMPRHGRPDSGSAPAKTIHNVEPGSPIATYRLEDYARIFSLYAKVAEHALRAPGNPTGAAT